MAYLHMIIAVENSMDIKPSLNKQKHTQMRNNTCVCFFMCFYSVVREEVKTYGKIHR